MARIWVALYLSILHDIVLTDWNYVFPLHTIRVIL